MLGTWQAVGFLGTWSKRNCSPWALLPFARPRSDASKIDALQNLWTDAGLDSVETRKIEVQQTFADFDGCGATAMLGSTIGPTVHERAHAPRSGGATK